MPSVAEKQSQIKVTPLSAPERKQSELGATIDLNGADLKSLSPEDTAVLKQALYDNSVLVIKGVKDLQPELVPELCKIWDQNQLNVHGHGKSLSDKGNILTANHAARVPHVPQVSIIGNGDFDDHYGSGKLELRHVEHTSFHKEPLSKEKLAAGETRFYRWHIDAPLYELQPAKVTMLYAIVIPESDQQLITFADGEKMPLNAGSTSFFSGNHLWNKLTPEEQDWALRTTVNYAPKPYNFMKECKATADGLTIVSEGKEVPLDQIEYDPALVQSHPLVWRNPGRPDKPAVQALGCCLHSLSTESKVPGEPPVVIDDLPKVRETIYNIQSRMMKPEYIYSHPWEKDDLVIFNNHAVSHSITGQLEGLTRLFWQCNLASKDAPVAARREEIFA